jgi:hypothetical protein
MRLGEYPDNSGMATANEAPARRTPPAATAQLFSLALKRQGRLLLQMGIGKPLIAQAMLLAEEHGTTVEEELLASGEINEAIYFEALAERLGLDFVPDIDPNRVQDIAGLDTQIIRPEMLRVHHASRPPITVIVPSLSRLEETAALLERTPTLRQSLAVSTPSVVRNAAWQAGRLRRVTATTRALFETTPLYSARITFWGKQGFYAGIMLGALIGAVIMLPIISLLILHIVLTLFYLANFLVRFYALGCAFLQERSTGKARAAAAPVGPLPVYTVLVALYREKSVAAQLIEALDSLDWPRSRLDIKLICEEDDAETIAALRALPLAPEYEIVLVPVHLPRTKPKALSYALPGVRGTFVTVYDAEDRPHPGQAPVTLPVWLGQRTRWFKGWLQTWLVLMRKPAQFCRETGWPSFAVFQILIAGMLVSSLCHPIIIGFLLYLTWLMFQHSTHVDGSLAFWLFLCDIVNLFGSYAVFIALGRNRMGIGERRAVGMRWACVPFYWLIMSLAAWKALLELQTNPFSWNKTPHVPVNENKANPHEQP